MAMAGTDYSRQKKYREKRGIISKSYSLESDMVERFAEACKSAGVSQSAAIKQLMQEFIDRVNSEEI